jgi:hypothetical protein
MVACTSIVGGGNVRPSDALQHRTPRYSLNHSGDCKVAPEGLTATIPAYLANATTVSSYLESSSNSIQEITATWGGHGQYPALTSTSGCKEYG